MDTEIQKLKQEIQLLQSELVKAQQKAVLGELLSTTTHEFNNILMTVINYAKLGLRYTDDEGRNKSFEKILAAGKRAAKISHGVLGMAKNRQSGTYPCEIQPMVEETLFLLEREMRKYRINIETKFAKAPQAIANPNQIQQVLINLLVNARQAMSEGGNVIVAIDHDKKNATVDLQVRDNGSGMNQEQLQRIFEPYYSTKSGPDESGKGGTGLGLHSCRKIIEEHNGRIRVASKVGVGTEFTIKLPAAPTKSVVAPKTSAVINNGISATQAPSANV